MAGSKNTIPRHSSLHLVTSVVTLAFWSWRRHWFFLLVTGIAMVAAVTIVCTVPLLSQVTQTAGLRSVLNTSLVSSEITFRATAAGLSSQTVQDVYQSVNPPFDQYLLPYLSGQPRLDVQTPGFGILSPKPPDIGDQMGLYATSMQNAASHVRLLQGRLPKTASEDVEVAITPATATVLHLGIGSVITLDLSFYRSPPEFAETPPLPLRVNLHVVGLFSVKPNDLYWHEHNFLPSMTAAGADYTALVSDQTFLSQIDQDTASGRVSQLFFRAPSYIYGYYYLNWSQISINQLDDLLTKLASTQTYVADHFGLPEIQLVIYPPHVRKVDLYGPVLSSSGIPSSLEQFRNRIAILRIPIAILTLQIVGLLLFFVSFMTGLLVDRQSGTITMLRSRGAGSGQIFGSFVTQSLGCGLIGLAAGPPLAVLTTLSIASRLLTPAHQDALSFISRDPVQALFSVRWYALVTVMISLLALILALYRVFRLNVWAPDNEAKRVSRRPFWQRLRLDILAALIGLTGYAISSYLANLGELLDAQTQTLVSSPLALVASVFLLLAAVLFLLRFFPLLLRLGSTFALRARGAIAMLALTQLARAPRQSLRMILLLTLAIAFATFTLIFAASQVQRAADIAAYQAGADFSGTIPLAANNFSLGEDTTLYRKIPGVMSVTAGYEEEDTAAGAPTPVQVKAVDPSTFAQTAIWTPQDSSQPLASLLAQLVARRAEAIKSGIIPAIIDATAQNSLALHTGSSFSMHSDNMPGNNLQYVVIAEVMHIPTINTSSQGGVMVDYQSLLAAEVKYYGTGISANSIWLRTSDDPAAVASVRAALNTPPLQLEHLYDRRMLADTLLTDPLSLTLTSILGFGATTALLLALVGNLLASWLSVRKHLTDFLVLRALGTTPKQMIGALLLGQGIVYATSLSLGVILGVLLTVTVVPALVFTSIPSNSISGNISTSEFYTLQHLIPVQVVVPPSLAIAFIVFVAICSLALVMMIGVVMQPSMSQMLRLEEDRRIDFSIREEIVTTRLTPAPSASRHAGRSFTLPSITLAFWGLRRTWFLTLLTGAGIVAAVTIACAVPLFSTVTTTSGLHGILEATPSSTAITLDTSTQGLSTRVAHAVQQQFDPLFQQYLGSYLSQQASFSIQVAGFDIITPQQPPKIPYSLRLVGAPIEQATPHLTLLQGRLPQNSSGAIETLLTPALARSLHVTIGSVITLRGDFFVRPQDMFGGPHPVGILKLHVVGLFNVTSTNDPFWHEQDFQPGKQGQLRSYTLLVPNGALLAALDTLATRSHQTVVFSPLTFELIWSYRLDPSRIAIDHLNALSGQLRSLQANIMNTSGNIQSQIQASGVLTYPYLVQVNLFNPTADSYQLPITLEQYSSRIAIVSIPTVILSCQIIVLILFFVSLMTMLLVERRADALALLHSRGASPRQLYSSLLIERIALGAIGLIVGPPLAVVTVSFISQRIPIPAKQDTISLITSHPIQAVLGIAWYGLAVVFVAILAMSLTLRRAATRDILTLRRETARETERSPWQRFNLDVVVAIIAFTGYGVSLYLESIGKLLDTRTRVLVSVPLSLVASIFLLTGSLLLLLRLLPILLQLGARLVARRRGAVSLLALTQVARAPRQTVRMTMLLALATAFAIFTLVFSASQSQRILDIAAYEAGADFNGTIPIAAHHLSLKGETAKYASIPGVISATAGYTGEGFWSGATPSIPIEIRAVDASTFARTAIWNTQDSSQPLGSLMAQLAAVRQEATSNALVPVIVDAATASKLALHVGSTFTLNVSSLTYSTLNCLVVAEVQHIPTVNSSLDTGTIGDYTPPGGILTEYTTYAAIYTQGIRASGIKGDHTLPINNVWLRTHDNPAALAHVRAALNTPALHLDNLYDRRALIDTLNTDPLYLGLIATLTLGVVTVFLLALMGDLLLSWLSVRKRLTSFVVLRALGTAPRQIAGVFAWEQGVVYGAALILGIVFGALLAITAVPSLIFTGVPISGVLSDVSSGEFYSIQHVIPAQVIVPFSLAIAFAGLIALCMLALTIMTIVTLRPSMSQTLRLNDD